MKINALAEFLSIEASEIEVSTYDDSTFEAEGGEYIVLIDSEANDKWDERMDSMIDDCIISQLPEQYRMYFDYEKFKMDASYDGRGLTLASYD